MLVPSFAWQTQSATPHFIRHAGRLNAAQASEKEEAQFLSERRQLLQKQMNSELTKQEKSRLEFVRWNLARFEDARIGPRLDRLEEAARRYGNFFEEISRLRRDLDANRSSQRR